MGISRTKKDGDGNVFDKKKPFRNNGSNTNIGELYPSKPDKLGAILGWKNRQRNIYW
jgi:hypothetical protein